MADDPAWQRHVRPCLYRPFDQRWIYWADWMVDWPRTEVNRHLTSVDNLALIARRQMLPTHPCNFFWVSRTIPIDGVIRSDNRAEFTAGFAQWMVKRKLTPAELRWITGIMKSTPTGIAVQLAADALFSDYRPELEKLSQEVPTLHVLGEEDVATAKPWLEENAPKARIEVLGRHMMFWEDSEAFNKIFLGFVNRSKDEETGKRE